MLNTSLRMVSEYSDLFRRKNGLEVALNPFPNKPWFLRVCRLLKTLREKEKLLVTSNFSFSHSVFYPSGEFSAILMNYKIVVCKLFQFGSVSNLSFGKGFTKQNTNTKGSCIQYCVKLLIEWCFTPLSTVFQSYHGDSSHYSCLSCVSPVLRWLPDMYCPRTLPRKYPEDPMRLEPRTPGLRVKHFTTEPRRNNPPPPRVKE